MGRSMIDKWTVIDREVGENGRKEYWHLSSPMILLFTDVQWKKTQTDNKSEYTIWKLTKKKYNSIQCAKYVLS